MSWIWSSIGRAIDRRSKATEAAVEPLRRDTMRMDAALTYASGLTLRQQRDRLNAAGQYEWIDRDSDWYPDYISTRCYPDYGFYKIFPEDDGRFNLTIKLVTDRDVVEAELARLVEVARTEVLPVVAATDIERGEPYD
jgi:hypothetical protein